MTQHILLRKKKSGVAFVFFDSPGKNNFITGELLVELRLAVQQIIDDAEIKAVIFISGKHDRFIADASLHEIARFKSREDALALVDLGCDVFALVERINKPTVAAINGECLGGGLEFALCCNRRIATNSPDTVLGLPEISVGLIPGLGGTQRLPRLIGVESAVDMTLASKLLTAKGALAVGLIDKVVLPDDLLGEAERIALDLCASPKEDWIKSTNNRDVAQLNKFLQVRARSTRIRTRGNYPADTKFIEVVQTGLNAGWEAGMQAEKNCFVDLSIGDSAKNLISLFFSKSLAKQQSDKLAAEFPVSKVRIFCCEPELHDLCQKFGIDSKNTPPNEADLIIECVQCVQKDSGSSAETADWIGIVKRGVNDRAKSDLTENVKREMTEIAKTDLSESMKPDAVLAILTSASSFAGFAEQTKNRSNLIGIQFMQPIEQMPLVELITQGQSGGCDNGAANQGRTSRRAIGLVTSFVRKLQKLPIVVPDSPGFLITRILTVYLLQAARLAERGVPVNWLEKSAVDFGMPIGPFAVIDEIGLDKASRAASELATKLGERFSVPISLKQALKAGLQGRSTGTGTYVWSDHKRQNLNPALETEIGFRITAEILSREQAKIFSHAMVLPMVDEAARCLEEKIVRRPREIDLALALGIGFPQFRGGLLKYADHIGIKQIVAELDEIYPQSSPATRISDYLKRLQDHNRGFYPQAVEED